APVTPEATGPLNAVVKVIGDRVVVWAPAPWATSTEPASEPAAARASAERSTRFFKRSATHSSSFQPSGGLGNPEREPAANGPPRGASPRHDNRSGLRDERQAFRHTKTTIFEEPHPGATFVARRADTRRWLQ